MKFLNKHKLIGLFLVSSALLFSCNDGTILSSNSSYSSSTSTSSSSNSSVETITHYNIVFTLATIPPVLAALESFQNDYETYAMIERGTTYRGIDKIAQDFNFHNIGFDTNNNTSGGFGQEKFNMTVNKIKSLNKGNDVFHIYLRDADVTFGFALVANAGLKEDQYELILCEDGSATYVNFKNKYVNNKKVTQDHDEPYEAYVANVKAWGEKRNAILAKNDNQYNNLPTDFDGLAASALDHVTWRIQNKNQLISNLQTVGDTKLLSILNDENNNALEYSSHIESSTISSIVKNLPSDKKRCIYNFNVWRL